MSLSAALDRADESRRLGRPRGGTMGSFTPALDRQAPGTSSRSVLIPRVTSDEETVLSAIDGILDACIRARRPISVRIIRIRDWFSSRWYRFAGKRSGLARVESTKLIVPPFVPNRVISELELCWDDQSVEYIPQPNGTALHKRQHSRDDLHRTLSSVAGSCVALWVGGDALESRWLAAMLYAVGSPCAEGWYLSVHRRASEWVLDRYVGLDPASARTFPLTIPGSGHDLT